MEYYSAITKSEMPLAATGVDLFIILLSEASQLEKDEIHIRLLMCGETENRSMSTRAWRLGKWGDAGQRAVQKLLNIMMSKFCLMYIMVQLTVLHS